MCKLVEITRDAIPGKISIEFERNAALRAIKVVIINRDHNGNEGEVIAFNCLDNGGIGSYELIQSAFSN